MLWFYEAFFPVVWIAFILYWRIKAAKTKTTQRLEPAASRILRVVALLIVIVLLSTTRIPLPWLYRQLVWLPVQTVIPELGRNCSASFSLRKT